MTMNDIFGDGEVLGAFVTLLLIAIPVLIGHWTSKGENQD